jgi:hypothetical protein
MNWDAVAVFVESIGALAVVISLVYLAIQTRHNAASTRSATEIEASRKFSAWITRVSEDDALQLIWDDVQSATPLSPDQYRRWLWAVADLFHMSEGIFFQHQKGLVSDEIWREFERTMMGLLQTAPTLEWWRGGNSPFSAPFKTHIESAMTKELDWRMPIVVGTQTETAAPSG